MILLPSNILAVTANLAMWENNIYSRISATAAPWCIQASVYKKFKEVDLVTLRDDRHTALLGHVSIHTTTQLDFHFNTGINFTDINTEIAAYIILKLGHKLSW